MYARKRNSGLRRQRKAEGGRGYQLFPHPRHIPPGLAKNSDCGRAGRAGGHNPPPFGLGAEPANTGTSPLPVGCSHIHPKTALPRRSRLPPRPVLGASHWGAAPGAAGVTKSFCPCRKTGGNTGFSPVSFLHELYGNGMHSAPGFLAWFLLFPTVPIPSTTQNAPGFAFSGFAGCASLFLSSFDSRNSPHLCIIPGP